MTLRLCIAACTLLASTLSCVSVQAADTNGSYANRGLGNLSCGDFVQARDTRSPAYNGFGGWIDGFLTAVNRYEQSTFDIAPWQTTDLLAASLARYCKENAEIPFHQALVLMARQLSTSRLPVSSERVIIEDKVDGKAVRLAMYTSIIERAQSRLKTLKMYKGKLTSKLDKKTKKALKKFQKKNKLSETGLPDQRTLLMLFSPAEG